MKGDQPGAMIVLTTVMIVAATLAVGTRLYARKLRNVKQSWDDWTIIAALIFTYGTALCMYIGVANGNLGRHSVLDPSTGLPYLTPTLANFFKINWVSLLTGTLSIGLTKVSVLLLYRRIFRSTTPRKWFSISIWVLVGFAILWTISFFFSSMFQCTPIAANWEGYGGTPEQCVAESNMYLAQAWMDSISDLLILAIPIPCVWSLQMPIRQKIAVSGMFLLGAVTVAISLTKLVYYYQITALVQKDTIDLTWILTPTVYWPLIESALGVVGACLPLIKPVFDDCMPFIQIKTVRSSLGSGNASRFTGSASRGQTADEEEKGLRTNGHEEYYQMEPVKSAVVKVTPTQPSQW